MHTAARAEKAQDPVTTTGALNKRTKRARPYASIRASVVAHRNQDGKAQDPCNNHQALPRARNTHDHMQFQTRAAAHSSVATGYRGAWANQSTAALFPVTYVTAITMSPRLH